MKVEKKKILIADSDRDIHQKIKRSRQAGHYLFESAMNGTDCLKKMETFLPDLLFIDLLLPHIHGIEILRKVKTDPRTNHVGIILSSDNMMFQNFHAAIKQKADYFLEKPYEVTELFHLFHLFFTGKLQPHPFDRKGSEKWEGKHCYLPKIHSPTSYLKFWGTRGSNPVSGPDYVRFGGNTSCLEIREGEDLIIIDAGTGVRPLGTLLEGSKPKTVHLLLGHTHWDHLAGFPFFMPIYDPQCHLHIYSPIGYEKTVKEIFTEMLAYAYFPVSLDDMKATVTFKDIHEGEPFEIGPFEINSTYAFHPGATLGFKIRCDKTTFGYVTDNELLMGFHGNPNSIGKNNPYLAPYLNQIKFFKGCDLLIHEAQYTPQEYLAKVGWGHSSIANAAVLIKYAEIDEWVITHHDPRHTDFDLLQKAQMQLDIFDECKIDCRIRMAFDGLRIPL